MSFFTNTLPLRAAGLIALVALSACKKSDDSTPTPAVTTYATTWTADGKNYTATTSSAGVSGNNLIIGATQAVSSTESYNLTLGVPTATGTYAIGSSSGSSIPSTAGYSTTVAGTNTGYVSGSGFGSGTIVVSTFSTTEVIGTFSFTAINPSNPSVTKAVTNGKFAIKR